MAHWLQVSLEVPGSVLEAVSATCEEAGALAVTLEDAADDPVYEPLPGEIRTWPHNRVSALFAAAFDPAPLRATLAGLLGGQVTGWRVTALADRDWERVWLDDFRPLRFGRRLWVCPTDRPPPDPTAVNLRLDPGLAFGTGTHPTTALCLEWLDGHAPPATLLDYGCGSGILAIAGLLLGARSAWAVDLDPQALTATGNNAAANGVAERLQVGLPEALPVDLRCDLLLANILAGPLVALAPALAARLAPGGALVLSGILPQQAATVAAAYRPWCGELEQCQRDGWVRLDGRRL
jgi:ribosomal protein L11 methyltransferase